MVHKYVLRDKGMQNNVWEIVDAMAMSKISKKTLSRQGGNGKSSVQNRYRNGVEIKIEYKYPVEQELFRFRENLGSDVKIWIVPLYELLNNFLNRKGKEEFGECAFYYNRNIVYETSYHGIRGVYTLGDNYYVIDHLPQTSLLSTASLAASWNMPKNTTQMGTSGWQQFVFEGTTPSGEIPGTNPKKYYTSRSRIELAVAGANGVESVNHLFQMKGGDADTLETKHLTFENNLNSHSFLIARIRACDITDTFVSISSESRNLTTVTGGIIWTHEFIDGSRNLIVYNPTRASQTVEGITSDAVVWILNAENMTNWYKGRLFGAIGLPTFSNPPVSVTTVGGMDGVEIQYDIVF